MHIHLTDAKSHEPLYPATLHWEQNHRNFFADEQGRLHLDSLCAGEYDVILLVPGEEIQKRKLLVTQNQHMDWPVERKAILLKQIIVTDKKVPLLLQQKSERLTAEKINSRGSLQLTDALEAVNGVQALHSGNSISKPVIQGMHSNRIVMVSNGVRMEQQQWGAEHGPNVSLLSVDNATVVKGAAGVQYGTDAIGGVVILEPEPLRKVAGADAKIHLYAASNNRLGAAAAKVNWHSARFSGWSIQAHAGIKKGGNYAVPNHIVANSGLTENNFFLRTGLSRKKWQAEVSYEHFQNRLGIYSGSHTGNAVDLEQALQSDTPLVYSPFSYHLGRPYHQVAHRTLKTQVSTKNFLGHWMARYSYQNNYRQEYDIMRNPTEAAQLNLTLQTQMLELQWQHNSIFTMHSIAGISGSLQTNEMDDGDRLFIPNYFHTNWALFHLLKKKIKTWNIEAGIRYDNKYYEMYQPEGPAQIVQTHTRQYGNLSSTLAASHRLSPHSTLGVVASQAWRSPQANELFSNGLHLESARIEIGNPQLSPEVARGLNVYLKSDPSKWHFDFSIYRQYINNFIYLSPAGQLLTIRGYYRKYEYHQTNASLTGADASIAYSWSTMAETKAQGNYLYAWDETQQDFLIQMPPAEIKLQQVFNFRNNVRRKKTFLQLELQHVFKQTNLPKNFYQQDVLAPPAAYSIVNAALGTTYLLGKHNVQINLNGHNLFNTAYRNYLDNFRYFINAPGRNFSLQLIYSF